MKIDCFIIWGLIGNSGKFPAIKLRIKLIQGLREGGLDKKYLKYWQRFLPNP